MRAVSQAQINKTDLSTSWACRLTASLGGKTDIIGLGVEPQEVVLGQTEPARPRGPSLTPIGHPIGNSGLGRHPGPAEGWQNSCVAAWRMRLSNKPPALLKRQVCTFLLVLVA